MATPAMTDVSVSNLEFSIYVSRAVETHSVSRLRIWSDAFAAKNSTLHITGLLLTVGDHFVQMLEGQREDVLALLKTIQRDPRHTDFRLIYLRPAAERSFAQWAMRWISLDERIYLGFNELIELREHVRSLVGNENAQKDAFVSLIRTVPALLAQHQLS